MLELKRTSSDLGKNFYGGVIGKKAVACSLDTDNVYYMILEGTKVLHSKSYSNAEKRKCYEEATKALNALQEVIIE